MTRGREGERKDGGKRKLGREEGRTERNHSS